MKRNTKTLLAIATAAAFGLGTATAFSDPGHGRGGYGGMGMMMGGAGMMGGTAGPGMMGDGSTPGMAESAAPGRTAAAPCGRWTTPYGAGGPAGGPGMGMMGRMMQGMMGGGMMGGPGLGGWAAPMMGGLDAKAFAKVFEARLERFRAQLGIRPDQEQAWKDFTEALAEPRAPQADARTFRGPGDRLAAVAERLGRLAEAANALYEKLDPPQRIAFDWLFRGMGRHRGF